MGAAERRGHWLWYSPNVWVFHRRRKTLGAYLEQVHRYGWGRANAIWHAPRTGHPGYFVPVAFVVYIGLLPCLMVLSPLALVPALAYGAACLLSATRVSLEYRRPSWLARLVFLYPMTHVAYGVGLMGRLLSLAVRRVPRTSHAGDVVAPD